MITNNMIAQFHLYTSFRPLQSIDLVFTR